MCGGFACCQLARQTRLGSYDGAGAADMSTVLGRMTQTLVTGCQVKSIPERACKDNCELLADVRLLMHVHTSITRAVTQCNTCALCAFQVRRLNTAQPSSAESLHTL